MIFFRLCQRVWKTVKCQEKLREKSGNFEVDDKWQPCFVVKGSSLEITKLSSFAKMTEKHGLVLIPLISKSCKKTSIFALFLGLYLFSYRTGIHFFQYNPKI